MQTRHSPMDWARKLLSGTQVDQNGEGIELPERRPPVVDVSFAKGLPASHPFSPSQMLGSK
jgi:hypothetical protein